jgi:hypothetical protein
MFVGVSRPDALRPEILPHRYLVRCPRCPPRLPVSGWTNIKAPATDIRVRALAGRSMSRSARNTMQAVPPQEPRRAAAGSVQNDPAVGGDIRNAALLERPSEGADGRHVAATVARPMRQSDSDTRGTVVVVVVIVVAAAAAATTAARDNTPSFDTVNLAIFDENDEVCRNESVV